MGSTLNRAAVVKVIKDRYPMDDEIWPQMNTGAPAMDLITHGNGMPKLGSTDAEGKQLIIPLRTVGNPNSAVPVREGKGYPTTGNQTYDNAVFNFIELVSSFQVTGRMRRIATGGAKSVRNMIEDEMKGQLENARQRLNKAIHSDGSGMLATCASVAGNVITLAAISAGTDLLQLAEGREIMIANKTTGALPTGHPSIDSALVISANSDASPSAPTITVLNEDGTTPTLTGITSSFGVYIRDAQGNDIPGFGVMCVPGNPANYGVATLYGGIDRSVAGGKFWDPVEVDAANSVASIQRHIQPLLAKIDRASGAKFGGKLWMFMAYDNFYALANSMGANNRTQYNVKLKGGWEGLVYNQAVAVLDFMAPVSEIRAVSPKTSYRYVVDDFYWEDDTGSIMERVSSATGRPTNTFRLNMMSRQTLISTRCKNNGRVKNLAAAA